ncbi:hypothetical protein GCM10028868_32650 [Virgibacillus kimchii]
MVIREKGIYTYELLGFIVGEEIFYTKKKLAYPGLKSKIRLLFNKYYSFVTSLTCDGFFFLI